MKRDEFLEETNKDEEEKEKELNKDVARQQSERN